MTYYVAYNPSLNNALVGVSDSTLPEMEGIVIEVHDGEMPDLSKFAWNTATLTWYEKFRSTLTKREFLKRFTPEEYSMIKVAAQANSFVDYYWQQFILAEEIIMSDLDTIAGIHLLEQAGILGVGRANEIIGV